jgi:hypothetical protein
MRKPFLAFAAVAALAAGAAFTSVAFAGEADPSGQFALQTQSTVARAQVRDELQQFRNSGVNPWAWDYNQLAGMRSEKTRAQVTAEFQADRAEAAALASEDSGSAYLAQSAPLRGTGPVLAAGSPESAH